MLLAFGSARAVRRAGLAAAAHPGHPDLRRRAADPGRARAGHRGVERLRVLGARRVRQRREAADLMVARADAKSPKNGRVGVLLRLLALGAQYLAHADLDGHRAGAAVPAGAGRHSRRAAAAAQPQRSQGRPVHRRAPDDRAVAGSAAGLRRVLQLLVHRHLRAAVRLAGGLSDPAAGRARPRPAGHPGSRPAQPRPAAQHHTAEVAGEPDAVAATVNERLRGWRRVTRTDDDITEISAEKGYLREFGNIVFHFSLLGLLVAVAAGKLFGYEGNVIVIADGGPGFCSASPAAFDSFRAGNTVDGTSLHPICLRVNDFEADYLPTGQATSFAANIDYQAGRRPRHQHLAAVPAAGQPSAARRRGPGVPAGPRLRADVHRHLPRRADPHPDRAVAARRSADPAVVAG